MTEGLEKKLNCEGHELASGSPECRQRRQRVVGRHGKGCSTLREIFADV